MNQLNNYKAASEKGKLNFNENILHTIKLISVVWKSQASAK